MAVGGSHNEKQPPLPPWLDALNQFAEKMLHLQDGDGGFKNEKNSEKGTFCTIEGLYPLLLHPQKERWSGQLLLGIEYVLNNTHDGKIPSTPEYPDIVDNYCVDSVAYGLYVFTLFRNYFKRYGSEAQKDELLSRIDDQIKNCIKIIEQHQNGDKGWPIIKDSLNFKSRTYSTALVVFALNNCEENKDFEKAKKRGTSLMREGAEFLVKNNRCGKGWIFSQPRLGDNAELIEPKTKPSVNLTAVVVFSLAHLLRTNWRYDWCDELLVTTIKEGAEFLWDETFTDGGNNLSVDKEYEPVDYPVMTDKDNGKTIRTTKFDYPYEMILPALILTPGYSIKSKQLTMLKNRIFNEIKETAGRSVKPWKLYDFSDKIFALLYYNYIDTLLEEGLDRFVKTSDVIRCVIDGSDACPDVRDALSKCPYSGDINSCPEVRGALSKCYYGGDINSCPHVPTTKQQTGFQRLKNGIKNLWMKLPVWSRASVIFFIELICTLPIPIYLPIYLNLYQISVEVPSPGTIWTIYAIPQTVFFGVLQLYYHHSQTDKNNTEGDMDGQKK